MHYEVTADQIKVVISDMGPGIPDIPLAMQEGYSTAPDWVRELGWGAGMGLPNMRKNADAFKVDSVVGEGTTIEITVRLSGEGGKSQ
jgi:anti-sigma regulatory factor (Ser/Thr protein kinase)